MTDPYLILDLLQAKMDGTIDDQTVKAAYMKLLKQYPPEHKPEQFKKIRQAFEQLQTYKKRLQYDLFDLLAPDLEDLSVLLVNKPLKRPSLKQVQQLLK